MLCCYEVKKSTATWIYLRFNTADLMHYKEVGDIIEGSKLMVKNDGTCNVFLLSKLNSMDSDSETETICTKPSPRMQHRDRHSRLKPRRTWKKKKDVNSPSMGMQKTQIASRGGTTPPEQKTKRE